MYCSPSHYKYASKGTCFSPTELSLIAKEINEREHKTVIGTRKKKEAISNYFKDVCNDKEYCWLNQLNYNTKLKLEHAFRPVKPRAWLKNPRTWLNTDDIQYVMSQYETLHKDFKFLGVHPIDFSQKISNICIGKNLCDFDIKQLQKRKRFAIVLNLDHHDEPGSHWVALYCSLYPRKANFGIYYYDSVSHPPSKEVIDFMKRITEQVKRDFPYKTAERFEIKKNEQQHQYKNTECGMFCIVFLTQCVKNIPFDELCKRMKSDDEINKIRNIIYRPTS